MSIPNDVPSYRPRWLWWSLPENFSTYDEYRSHLLSTGKFDGSPLHEIISLLFLGPFSVFLTWGFVTWNLGSLHSTSQINSKLLLVFEFGFILLTALIALTAGCDQPASILAAVIVAAFGFLLAIDRREGVMTAAGRKSRTVVESFRLFRALNLPSQQTPGDPAGIDGILRQSVAEYRTLVLVVTVICILAVDFPAVFPDKFHKSAKFGTSIMDLGVGGFIVANGLVAREARSLTTLPGVKKPSVRQRFQTGLKNMNATFRSSALLVGMGVGRALAVAIFDYPVIVTEYGVHWNFFLTLASVKMIASAVFTVVPHRLAWLMGLWNLIAHQLCLSFFGLQRIVLFGIRAFSWAVDEECPQSGSGTVSAKCLEDPRLGFVDANREGIFSIWGFLSLYFFSVQLGRFFFRPKSKVGDWLTVIHVLLASSVVSLIAYFALTQIETSNVLFPSRRIANSAYVLWTIGNCCFPLALSLVLKTGIIFMSFQHGIRGRVPDSVLMNAINNNPLGLFIAANLLTGVVNLLFPTLLMDVVSATTILVVYLVILTSFAYILSVYRIKIA